MIRVLTPSIALRSVTRHIHMTVLAVRQATTERRRFGRSDESRKAHMDHIRERIERDDYAVDPQKVAAAIVRRLLSDAKRDQCS
jgi:anti-sigma28 factor (negative regulator of flagellin synthesis)